VPAAGGAAPASFRLTAPRLEFRQDRADQLENPDRTEPRLAMDPSEYIEHSEAADPIDKMEPADPMDKIEPVEPIDRIEPADPIDKMDPVDPRLQIDDPVGLVRRPGPAKRLGLVRRSGPVKRREASVIRIAHCLIPG
jgi:hypothetical protein